MPLAIAESDQAPPAARVTAARATIDLATRLRDQVDVVERLAAVEAILAARTDGAP